VTDEAYLRRSEFIDEMCRLFKIARRPVPKLGVPKGIDAEGYTVLFRLAGKLSQHPYFEHLSEEELKSTLRSSIDDYQASGLPKGKAAKEFATDVLDRMSNAPTTATVYFAVRYLTLPPGIGVVGDAEFVRPEDAPEAAGAVTRPGSEPPQLLCAAEATGGTRDLLVERAARKVERALALVRQQTLHGFMAKIYFFQVQFALDGRYAYKGAEGEAWKAGGNWSISSPAHWSISTPTVMDLTDLAAGDHWCVGLNELADELERVPSGLLGRVDTCLAWLDVSARAENWRVVIPALFSAMESLLVPETLGLKAGIVTVRSVAVHVALQKGFFHPKEVFEAYDQRDRLIHGKPITENEDRAGNDLADDRRRWAFRVFSDYIELVSQLGLSTIDEVVAHLDSDPAAMVCTWLAANGRKDIAKQYRRALGAKD